MSDYRQVIASDRRVVASGSLEMVDILGTFYNCTVVAGVLLDSFEEL